jgi:hypothetical protein
MKIIVKSVSVIIMGLIIHLPGFISIKILPIRQAADEIRPAVAIADNKISVKGEAWVKEM